MHERVGWREFNDSFDWRQGEHVTLIGPTGSGKSWLERAILPRRQFVIVCATKPDDDTLPKFKRDGYTLARKWPPPATRLFRANGQAAEHRVLLWPRFKSPADQPAQRAVFHHALPQAYTEGRWTIVADELRYMAGALGMAEFFELVWLTGRGLKLSLVTGLQRPRWVPLEAFSQSSHLFIFQTSDEDDLRRLGGIGGLSRKEVQATVAGLDFKAHECLYVDARRREAIVTRVERT